MVDLLAFGSAIIFSLYGHTEHKTLESIDKAIEEVNSENEYFPILFRDKSVLVHSKSRRYGNGSLVGEFINAVKLEPNQEEHLLQLQNLKLIQQGLYERAVTAVIESCLGILQNTSSAHTRQQTFILLFDEALWKDKEFIKPISEYLEDGSVQEWYAHHSKVFSQPNLDVQSVLLKIDADGTNRKIIREFTDIYYGLDFLDNF